MARHKSSRAYTARTHERAWTLAAGAFFLVALALILYYIALPAQVEFHSDCTDTLLWARASYESGDWISKTFYYACYLPFGTQLIMQLFMGAFGYSMTTHILGMSVFALVFAAAALGMFRAMRWRFAESFAAAGALLLLLAATAKSREIFYNHTIYYSLGVLSLMTLILLALRVENAEQKYARALLLTACFAVSFMAAANGLSQFAICLVPFGAALVVSRLLEARGFRRYFSEAGAFKRDLPLLTALVVGAVAGFLFLKLVLTHDMMAWYESRAARVLKPEEITLDVRHLVRCWRDLFDFTNILGLPETLHNAFERVCTAGLLGLPILPLVCYRRLNRGEKLMTMCHWMLAFALLGTWMFTGMGGIYWRLLPGVASAIACSGVALKLILRRFPLRRIWAAVCALCIIALIGGTLLALPSDREQNVQWQRTAFLKANGLTKGYATFFNAQAVMLFSEGEINIQQVGIYEDKTFEVYNYQIDPAWFSITPGEKVFLLVQTDRELPLLPAELPQQAAEILICEGATILIFYEPLFS